MTGLLRAIGTATAAAIQVRPVSSCARRKTFVTVSAARRHIITTVAGHQSENQLPTSQAGAIMSGRPGPRKSYHSVGGRLEENAESSGRGKGASMPTKPGGWGARS